MKPLDLSKFKKDITKKLTNISSGFHDPTTWINTGNYAVNYMISGDFKRGVPLGKVTVIAGESGSGKSYLASGNIIRDAQRQGIFVVLIDTENALDETWLHNLGVDTSEDKLLKFNVAMIDEVAKLISDFMASYKSDWASVDREERPKVLFVIDSLGMLMTPTDVAHFENGDLKGDMGRKPKALKALITNCTNMFGEYDIGLVCTNHTYASQNMFDPDPVVSGGAGPIYAASILLVMGKLKLKEDEEGNKVSEVLGIRSVIKCMKTRYNKPFESTTVQIPYSTGMNPYSGLIEMFEKKGILVKDGNKLKYNYLDGTEDKWFRKQLIKDTSILDKIIEEFPTVMKNRESERLAALQSEEETLDEE